MDISAYHKDLVGRKIGVSNLDIDASARIAFLDNIRYLMVVFVVVYHSIAAYATVSPHMAGPRCKFHHS